MRSTYIPINDKELELRFTTRTMLKISERCGGDIDNLSEYIGEGTPAEKLEKICLILTDLANGAIIKNNADIDMGLAEGEKKRLFTDNYFVDVVNPAELSKYSNCIWEAVGNGMQYTVPDNVTLEEKDAELMELERNKRKNE